METVCNGTTAVNPWGAMIRVRSSQAVLDPLVFHYQATRPIDWQATFGRPGPLEVEIGFGLGDFLVRTAQQFPERNFVGIEQDWERVKKGLQKIAQLPKTASAQNNIRILQIDARVAFERLFAPQTVGRIFCLFPCPWPKKSHVKHRLFSRDFLRLLNSRLVPGGEVRIVTDYFPFFLWVQEHSEGTGFRKETSIIEPQFNTKYERKWREKGQQEFFELRLEKTAHVGVPLEEDAVLEVFFAENFDPEKFRFKDVTGDTAVVLKDFMFDSQRRKAMLRVVVAEKSMTQHLWVVIAHGKRGWCVAKAEGHTVIPTAGVAQALRLVFEEVQRSATAS